MLCDLVSASPLQLKSLLYLKLPDALDAAKSFLICIYKLISVGLPITRSIACICDMQFALIGG